MDKKIKILGIAGSLRQGSYNKMLLRAAAELAPTEAEIEICDIGALPMYNQDLETNAPPAVTEFINKIKNADAVLFVTPEYNYSIPGVLKNAIDWGSRPYGKNCWEDKPAAIMSASPGMLGGSRAQYGLRQILVAINMHALNRPEIFVPAVQEKFDKDGKLTDELTKAKIKEQLEALAAWTKRLQK
jgi:chromate reductase